MGVAAKDPVPDPPGASASGHKDGAASLPHPPGTVGHKRQVLRVTEEKRGLVTLTLMRSGPPGWGGVQEGDLGDTGRNTPISAPVLADLITLVATVLSSYYVPDWRTEGPLAFNVRS